MTTKWIALCSLLGASTACGDDEVDSPLPPPPTTCQPIGDATYHVTFDALWSQATHPDGFPANPHFSGLIGATHDARIAIWAPTALASDGIEEMAETGGKGSLEAEIQVAIDQGTAGEVLSGGGVNPSPGSVSLTFDAAAEYPLVSLVSMIAPSPDWFVGVHGLSLCANDVWVEDLTVSLLSYDAGTDSGESFTAADADTQPPDPISRLSGAPFESNGQPNPLGTLRFVRQ